MAEAAGGGGPPSSGPAPAYVEPNPNAFYRMAFAAKALTQGLNSDPNLMSYASTSTADVSLDILLQGMGDLGDTFERFGDIAAKEIQGDPLSEDDYSIIWRCLSVVECATVITPYNIPTTDPPPVPVIAAVSGYLDTVLEVGVGLVDRIYVVVPLEGKLQVAQGGVFTYYEFKQPRDNRLTDQQWRDQLVSGSPPALPKWAPQFVLTGGKPTHWTIFKIGDWYTVTTAGDGVNLRQTPSTSAAVLAKIPAGSYIQIIDGPVQADGQTWWKIDNSFNPGGGQGWIVENQDWYLRV